MNLGRNVFLIFEIGLLEAKQFTISHTVLTYVCEAQMIVKGILFRVPRVFEKLQKILRKIIFSVHIRQLCLKCIVLG